MYKIKEFLSKIENESHRARVKEILDHIQDKYPELKLEYKWNQPMFTHNRTYIIALSVSKPHISISPEKKGMEVFKDDIKEAGYVGSKMLFRIKWEDDVNYNLIYKIVEYNMEDKKGLDTFWRK